ncbi:hypothetical protein YC2023_044750 [Brassica napus]
MSSSTLKFEERRWWEWSLKEREGDDIKKVQKHLQTHTPEGALQISLPTLRSYKAEMEICLMGIERHIISRE